LPEVIQHGETGFLHAPEDLGAMADSGVRLLQDAKLHAQIARAARAVVSERFCTGVVVPLYEACYRGLLAKMGRAAV
jgi:glycosyltransferase involved in cell wall biosynthesis